MEFIYRKLCKTIYIINMNINSIKNRLEIIIFGTDTKAGKLFDVALLFLILTSVFLVIMESIPGENMFSFLSTTRVELIYTTIFALEYLLRIWISSDKKKYIFSFWGIIDFVAVLPSILLVFLSTGHYFAVIRGLRLLRVFRILKLTRYMSESIILIESLKNSFKKIIVFLMFVLMVSIIMGTVMYVIEGGYNAESSFRSIPDSIYWAIVTITTVGYGDIIPQTVIGKFISSLLMLVGYGVIAIPTGIVTAEVVKSDKNPQKCLHCHSIISHEAKFCAQCGTVIS